MKASWKNLQEEVGKMLLPTYDKFGKIIQKDVIPALEKLSKVIPDIIEFFQQNKTVLIALTVGIMGAVGAYKATSAIMEVVDTLKATWTALTNAQTVATVEATAAQEGLNVAMSMNPIGLVVAAVTALIGVFGIAVSMAGQLSSSFDSIKAPQVVYDAATGKVQTQNQRVASSGSQLRNALPQNQTSMTAHDLYEFRKPNQGGSFTIGSSAEKEAIAIVLQRTNMYKTYTRKVLKILANDPSLSLAEAFKKALNRDASDSELGVIKNNMTKTLDNVLAAQKTISHEKLAQLLSDPQFGAILEASTEEQRKKLIAEAKLTGEEWAKAFIEGGDTYGSYTTGLQDFMNPILEADTKAQDLADQKAQAIKDAKANLMTIAGSLQAVAMATREVGQNEQATIDQIANIKQAVLELKTAGGISQAVYDQDVAFVDAQAKSLEMIQRKRDAIQATIAQARDYIKSTAQGIMGEADVTKMGSSSTDITANMQSMLARVFKFRSNLSKLKDMGLDVGVLQELLNAGSEAGGATAETLVSGGQSFIDSLNGQFAGLKDLANTTAEMMGQTMYGTGVDSTDGLIKGLRSKDAQLFKQAQALGAIIKDGVLNPTKQGAYKNSAQTIMSGVKDVLGKSTSGQSDFSSGVNPYATTVTNNFTVVGSQDPVTTTELLFQRFNAGFIGGQP
jgi:hypothetical protein